MKTFAVLLLAAALAPGQRILFNEGLDKKGKEAKAAADKLASAPATNKQLENLTRIEKLQVESALRDGELTMRTQIQALRSWSDVSLAVCRTLLFLYADGNLLAMATPPLPANCGPEKLKQAKVAIASRISPPASNLALKKPGESSELDRAIGTFRAATARKFEKRAVQSDTPSGNDIQALLDAALGRIADIKELQSFASSVPSLNLPELSNDKVIGEVEKGIKEIGGLLVSAASIWSTYVGVSQDPRDLMPSREKLGIALIAIESERIKELTLIRAAHVLYLEDLKLRLEDAVAEISQINRWFSADLIELDLKNAVPNAGASSGLSPELRREKAIYALHLATAGAVVNLAPHAVRELRASLANRRHDIRRDAVYNGAYEVALKAAGERLSAYYGAGVKTSQIASLLYYLSGIVSFPAIAF